MLLRVDRMPAQDAPEHEKQQALHVYRKITALRCAPCCGMCGTTRYATRPFWSVGMRVCKDCVRANLVSNTVLYERFWLTPGCPVQGHPTFVDAIVGKVFFFNDTLTVHQRLDYSIDRMDFPGGRRSTWFFWLPHLTKALDMDRLAREAWEKHAAARIVRAQIRRCLVLRALAGLASNERTKPTILTTYTGMRKDNKRTAMARLRKTELLDKVDWYHEQRLMVQLKPELLRKLNRYKDRVLNQPEKPGQ
jgi:hypothetical protein